ncbi:hypothetical protein CF70_017920 [Cupriavidus sp. SK-3]|nr:hypothetical protein CF70_017920 [Cupriavidus sp. SK-3]
MKAALDWILRIAAAALAWLHIAGSAGAGRAAVVVYSVMATLGLTLSLLLVAMCLSESGRAALRSKRANWPRYPVARWIWSLSSVAYLAWTEHQWLASMLLLVIVLTQCLCTTAHEEEPASAAGG